MNISRPQEKCLCVSHRVFAFDDGFIEGNKHIPVGCGIFGFALA